MKQILKKGIDVSYYQGDIDWEKVKSAGVEFAIIRCGYGMDVKNQDDEKFERNVTECERLGIPYGVYLYSYADSVEKAESEAAHTLRMLNGRKPLYPVYYDLENAQTTGKCSKEQILEIAKTFVSIMEANGLWAGIYANLHWNNTLLTDGWYDSKARWIAQWSDNCTYGGKYGIWQYTSSGRIDGINGNVDLDYAYTDYPALISSGAVKEPEKQPKTTAELVNEVIAGAWGNGEERRQRLTAEGYNYAEVQAEVNKLMGKPAQKSNEDIAKEVARGSWGNGKERKDRLTAAGYNYSEIQGIVNKLLK